MRELSLGLWIVFFSGVVFSGDTSFASESNTSEENAEKETVVEEPLEPATLRNDRILASQLAAGQMEGSEAKWMKAGGTEFLGIFTKDSSGKTAGSLLILPAPGFTPFSPGILPLLATEPATRGWHTLGISLPEFDFSPPAPMFPKANVADIGDDSTAEDNKEEAPASPEVDKQQNVLPEADKYYAKQATTNMENLLGRLVAAEAELLAKNGQYVMLAQGASAEMVLELISNKVIKPAGLITLNIDHPVAQRARKIPSNLAAVKIPVLDVYNMANKQKADKRKLKQSSSGYRQLFIPGNEVNFRGSEALSLRSVKGWLEKNF